MFFPRKTKVFENLIEQSSIMIEAADVFQKIVLDWNRLKEGHSQLEKLEGQADELVHRITDEVEKVFILPLDKEDIKNLTECIDDIVDNLEQVTNRLKIYKISASNQQLKDFSALIFESAQKVHQGILMAKERKFASKGFSSLIEGLHELENKGDKIHRKILEEMLGKNSLLFARDPISLIKWKEIFQTLEDTLDKFEEFAIIFGILRIKYA